MNFIKSIKDSVETSVSIKIFSSIKISSYYHIFKSKYELFPIAKCNKLHNFNPARLSTEPYPENNRPRGKDDLHSVLYHRRKIKKEGMTEPIWIILKNNEYTLLDGAHRIVSYYLEGKKKIPCFIIHYDSF
jgi:hypothetical protein